MSALDVIKAGVALLLPDLNLSNGSIENKIIDVVATYADSETIERNNTIAGFNESLAKQKVTTKEYYRLKATEYQIGDQLLIDPVNQGGYYNPVNPENQIIKQAYIAGVHPQYTLLVNTIGQDGHLRRLNDIELAGFKTFYAAFQPLGLEININSLDPAKVYIPNLIIYVRAGNAADSVVEGVEAALLTAEQTLRDTNVVTLSEIEDIIQSVTGVAAVSLGSSIYAVETQLDGDTVTTTPVNGIFNLINGAYTVTSEITTSNIQVLL